MLRLAGTAALPVLVRGPTATPNVHYRLAQLPPLPLSTPSLYPVRAFHPTQCGHGAGRALVEPFRGPLCR